MNRKSVFALCLLTVALFGGLAYYGWSVRWGGPPQGGLEPPAELAVPHINLSLALEPDAFAGGPWDTLKPAPVHLLHQITAAPHGAHRVPELLVRAFHNGAEVCFLFEWPDSDESRTHGMNQFPDACAVAFSLDPEPPRHSIMMGFQSAVNIWQWKADLDAAVWRMAPEEPAPSPTTLYTYEGPAGFPARTAPPSSACQDLISGRPGTVTVKPWGQVVGRGQWRDGRWRAIIKRPLAVKDPGAAAGLRSDVQLGPGTYYATFAVWDGGKGDRGSRKSISDWVVLRLEPPAAAKKPQGTPRQTRSGLSFFPSAEAATVEPEPHKEAKPRVITIKAKRFEYNPSEITVEKGELITLRLESLDVTHGLYLDGYEVDIKANPTEVGVATFVADKPGRFTFRCSETCGEFHPYMIGYLTVTPNTQFNIYVAATLVLAALIAAIVLLRPIAKKGAA